MTTASSAVATALLLILGSCVDHGHSVGLDSHVKHAPAWTQRLLQERAHSTRSATPVARGAAPSALLHREVLQRGAAELVRRGAQATPPAPDTMADGPTPQEGEATDEPNAQEGDTPEATALKKDVAKLHTDEDELENLKDSHASEKEIEEEEHIVEAEKDKVDHDEQVADGIEDEGEQKEETQEKATQAEDEEILEKFTDAAREHKNPAVLVSMQVDHFPDTAGEETRKAFKDTVVEAFNKVGKMMGNWTIKEEEVSISLTKADSPALVIVRIRMASNEAAAETRDHLQGGGVLADAVTSGLKAEGTDAELQDCVISEYDVMVQDGTAGAEHTNMFGAEGHMTDDGASEEGSTGVPGPVGPAGPPGPKGPTPDASPEHLKGVASQMSAELAVAFHFILLWVCFKMLSSKLAKGRKKILADLKAGKPDGDTAEKDPNAKGADAASADAGKAGASGAPEAGAAGGAANDAKTKGDGKTDAAPADTSSSGGATTRTGAFVDGTIHTAEAGAKAVTDTVTGTAAAVSAPFQRKPPSESDAS